MLTNSVWCNTETNVKVNELSISSMVDEILSNNYFLNSISENFGEDVKNKFIIELNYALETNFENYDIGNILAINNLDIISNKTPNLNLSENENYHYLMSINTIPIQDALHKDFMFSDNSFDYYKFSNLFPEDDRSVIGSVLVYMVISGAVHSAVEAIGLLYQYNGNPFNIPTDEYVTALVSGFAYGFVAGGLDIVALMIGGPMAGAASFLNNLITTPGFGTIVEDLIDDVVTNMLGPFANWTYLDYYNPQNYIDLFLDQPTALDSITDSCAVAINDYLIQFGDQIVSDGNVIACNTWSYEEDSQYNQVQVNFNNYEFIKFGMSFVMLENDNVTVELFYSDGNNSILAASGTHYVQEGDYIAIMSSGLQGHNIIDNLGFLDDYIVEGSAQTLGSNACFDIVDEDDCGHFSINLASTPILSNGSITPENGNPNTNFNFLVTYTDPGNQAPDYIELHVENNTYPMSGTGNWSNGVDFSYSQSFAIGNYNFHYEGYASGQFLRFPTVGEMSFEVEQQTGNGMSLSFSMNPLIEGEMATIYATLNPTLANYPIRFIQNPTLGVYQASNPVYTNANGVAAVDYFPLDPGWVEITALDHLNTSNYVDEDIEIIPEPLEDYIMLIYPNYLFGTTSSATYELYIRVYESDGDEASNVNVIVTTNMGLFSNNQQTINTQTDSHGKVFAEISFTNQGLCTVLVEVGNSLEYEQFDVIFVSPPYQLNSFIQINHHDYIKSFDWSPVDPDIIYYNRDDENIASYSISQRQVINNSVVYRDDAEIEIVRVSPDGSRIAFSSLESDEDYIRLYNINNGNLITRRDNINPSLDYCQGDFEWINNNQILAGDGTTSSGFSSSILTYSGSSTMSMNSLKDTSWRPKDVSVTSNLMAICYEDYNNHDGIVSFWNNNGYHQFDIDPHPQEIEITYTVSISDDGSRIAISDNEDDRIKIYDSNGNFLSDLSSWYIFSLEWMPGSSRYLLSSDESEKVVLWDTQNGTQICYYEQNDNVPIFDIRWSPDGNLFGIVEEDERLKIFSPWDHEGPSISVTSPSDSSSTQQQSIPVNGLINDDNGVSWLKYNVNNGSWIDINFTGNTFAHNVSLVEGSNTITYQAQDIYTNPSENILHVTRLTDQEPPNITNIQLSDTNPEIGNSTILTAYIVDGWTGVNNSTVQCIVHNPDSTFSQPLNMYDDGTNGDVTPNDNIFTRIIETSTLSEITYFIDITSSDNNNNTTFENNATSFETFDYPTFSSLDIQPSNITITDSVYITIEMTDQSGILNAFLYYDIVPFNLDTKLRKSHINNSDYVLSMQNTTGNEYETVIPPQNEPEIYFYIEAMDGVNNIGNSIEYSYPVIDNLSPVISNIFHMPSDVNEDVIGDVEVRATIVDLGYAGVQNYPQLSYQRGENYEPFSAYQDMDYLGNDIYSFFIPEPTVTWDSLQGQTLSYQLSAQDNSGNPVSSVIITDFIEPINDPPYFVFPNLEFYEDSTATFDFSNYVFDVDNTLVDSCLTWTGNDTIQIVKNGWYLTFSSNIPNWHGTEDVTFSIDDFVVMDRNARNLNNRSTRSMTSETVPITAISVDDEIVVNEVLPVADSLTIYENESMGFTFSGYDPDGNQLEYSWLLDGSEVSIDSTYIFTTDYTSAGNYIVNLEVTDNFGVLDGLKRDSCPSDNILNYTWNVEVIDVDQPIVVNDLSYADSTSGVWQTIDQNINENDTLYFFINAYDPDDNTLEYCWRLDGVEMTSDSIYCFATDYLGALSSINSPFNVTLDITDNFSTTSRNKTNRNNLFYEWEIIVNDVDQNIVVDSLSYADSTGGIWQTIDQDIDEGDSLNFFVSAYDPDGNNLDYIWQLDGVEVSVENSYTFLTDWQSGEEDYLVSLDVDDNFSSSDNELYFEWNVHVYDTVGSGSNIIPMVTKLYKNFPNPFNPTTTINFSLKSDSKVQIEIYNIKGQKVKQLVSKEFTAGQHSVVWNGRNEKNESVSSGIYFYRMKTDNFDKMRKMILLK